MTAVAEHVLDAALAWRWRRLTAGCARPFWPASTSSPRLRRYPRCGPGSPNERALGLSFIYAAQTWRQLVICYGEDEARALFGLTNNIVVFGGGKDVQFYQELSDLVGTTRVARRSYNQHHGGWGTVCTARTCRSSAQRRSGNCLSDTRWSWQRTPAQSSLACRGALTGEPDMPSSRHRRPPGHAALERRRYCHEPPVGHHGRAFPEPVAGRDRRAR